MHLAALVANEYALFRAVDFLHCRLRDLAKHVQRFRASVCQCVQFRSLSISRYASAIVKVKSKIEAYWLASAADRRGHCTVRALGISGHTH